MKRKIFLIIFTFLFLFLAGNEGVFARNGEGVGGRTTNPLNPEFRTWFMYELKPGESYDDVIEVINTTDQAWMAHVYPTDKASGNGFGLKQKVEPMEEIGAWIHFPLDKVHLEPGEHRFLPFTITLPKDATEKEVCGGIAIEKNDPEITGPGVRLYTRNSVRVYNNYVNGECADTKEPEKKVDICHLPKKVTKKAVTLNLPESAAKNHLAHGDLPGACPKDLPPTFPKCQGPKCIEKGKDIKEISPPPKKEESKTKTPLRPSAPKIAPWENKQDGFRPSAPKPTITPPSDPLCLVPKVKLCLPAEEGKPQKTISVFATELKKYKGTTLGACEPMRPSAPQSCHYHPTNPRIISDFTPIPRLGDTPGLCEGKEAVKIKSLQKKEDFSPSACHYHPRAPRMTANEKFSPNQELGDKKELCEETK